MSLASQPDAVRAEPIPRDEASRPIQQRLLAEVPIYLVSLALGAACIALLMGKGAAPQFADILSNARLFALFGVVAAVFDAAWQINRQRPASPLAFIKARYTNPALLREIASGLPMLAVAICIMPFFSRMKAAIPLFNDFTWDEAFIQWDRALFFGHDAWEIMQPVLGFPIITAALAFLYHVWFLLLYPGVMFFVFARIDGQLRRQFFLTYTLSWALVGGLMATLFASVGPCFLEPMLGDAHFAQQMAYLHAANQQVPIVTLPVQELLLEWHGRGRDGIGSGITAMPSMHCAIAFLYWVAVRRISARWGAVFAVFFFVTWISSVHLAYHYAVDGLVSLIAVAAIWAVSQRIVGWWDALTARGNQPTLRTKTVPAE